MNSWLDNMDVENIAYRYIEALEEGNMHRVASILECAELKPELWEALEEIHCALHQEEQERVAEQHLWKYAFATEESKEEESLTEDPSLQEPTDSSATKKPTSVHFGVHVASALSLCVLALCIWVLEPFSTQTSRSQPRSESLQASLRSCLTRSRSSPTQKKSWIAHVNERPQELVQLFKTPMLRRDALALLNNQHLSKVVSKHISYRELTHRHRVIRARLYLRMARFHNRNYTTALQLSADVYKRRLQRSNSLQLGTYFHYYRGRIQCLQGEYQAAQRSFIRAQQSMHSNRQERIRAWRSVCTPKPLKHSPQLTFKDDPDGWSEWVILRHLFPSSRVYHPHHHPLPTLRAQLYAKVHQKDIVLWSRSFTQQPIDVEYIQEQGIRARLAYYDPVVYKMMAHSYAHRTLSLLREEMGRYASFYKAEAYFILGQKSKAQKTWAHFLQTLPQHFKGEYFFFSHRLSVRSLQHEACYYQARLLAPKHPHIAQKIVRTLGQFDYPTRSLAGLAHIQIQYDTQKGYTWLTQGTQHAHSILQKMRTKYTLSSIQETELQKKRGAQVISQWALYKYHVRSMWMWASIGALRLKRGAQATHWLERLHQKHTPYKISGTNAPLQFSWTTRAYFNAGKPGVAALFLSKNLKDYPSLKQLWVLLRVWRIDEGMDSVPRIKG